MSQALDSLPPPAVEWRRESEDERRNRLERSGVLAPEGKHLPAAQTPSLRDSTADGWSPQKWVAAAQAQKNAAKKSYILWCGIDLGRWNSIVSPKETRTISDGSFGLNFELTHAQWNLWQSQLGFGPKVIFYHGGQYARHNESSFSGRGYSRLTSSEVGLHTTLTRKLSESHHDWVSLWSWSLFYLPVRFIDAETTSSVRMIPRSDTHSRTAMSLPGFGIQATLGVDWNSLLKADIFAGVQGAWPLQLRSRLGFQLSLALMHDLSTPPGSQGL